MADEFKTEDEQLEEFRAWWKENGNYVLAGVAIAALGLFGWNYMSSSESESHLEASTVYADLTDEIVDEDFPAAEALAATIATDYVDTPYFVQSKLAMARLYMDQNRDMDAVSALRDVIANEKQPALQQVARLRLAKILLYQEKPDEALETLRGNSSDAFKARFAEVRGDAHVALEQFEDARVAFTDALQDPNASQTVDQNFIRLKLYDLPATDSVAEATDASDAGAEEETADEEGGA